MTARELHRAAKFGSKYLGVNCEILVTNDDSKISRDFGGVYRATTRQIFIRPEAHALVLFHEMVHALQHDRGEPMFVNWGCILKEKYWSTYFFNPWRTEFEARAISEIMLRDYEFNYHL